MNFVATDRSTYTWSGATHVWPAFTNLPQVTRAAATSMSALSSTRHGLLPPSSSVTGVRCPCGRRHDDARDALVARVEHVSKRCSSSAVVLATPPSTTATPVRVQELRDEPGDRRRHVRRDLGRLDDRGIPAAMQPTSGAITIDTG
jgi:hypothetical protein